MKTKKPVKKRRALRAPTFQAIDPSGLSEAERLKIYQTAPFVIHQIPNPNVARFLVPKSKSMKTKPKKLTNIIAHKNAEAEVTRHANEAFDRLDFHVKAYLQYVARFGRSVKSISITGSVRGKRTRISVRFHKKSQ